jgi:tetratricopeptide (TPR) repeat protein
LGYLPLAIEQAGAYISDVQMQLDEYLPLYEKHRRELLKRAVTGDIYNPRRQTAFTTWEVSYEMLEKQDPAAAEMMLLIAFLHHETAWEGLFELALAHDTDDGTAEQSKDFEWLTKLYADRLAFRSAFGRIMSFSLAKRAPAPPQGRIVLHPLVHAWGRDRLSPSKKQQKLVHALFLIGKASKALSECPSMPEYSSLKRRLLSNADACLGFIRSDSLTGVYQSMISKPECVTAFYCIAALYIDFGRLQQCDDLLNSVLSSSVADSNIGLRAECQRRLAEVFEQQGKFEKARDLYEVAIDILTKLYGDQDARVLTAITGLGTTLWHMSRLPEARNLLQLVLSKITMSSPLLGEVGRKAGSTLSLIYWHLGLMADAVACQRRVIADIDADEQVDIFSTLEPRYLMALMLQEDGQWKTAESMFSDIFAERLKLIGPDTLDTARTATALARISCFLGKYDRARELLDFAWKQQQKLDLENVHRAMLRTLFTIGVLNREEGLYDEALELLERSSALEATYGERHHWYIFAQLELAVLKNDWGLPQEALSILEKVRAVQQEDFPPEKPNSIRATMVMAQSLLQLDEIDRAEEVLGTAEDIAFRFLSPDHPENLKIHVTKAAICLSQNRGDQALEDLKDTIHRLDRILGEKHPDSIRATALLGQIYLQMGFSENGFDLIQRSTKALKDCFGNDHPKVKELCKLKATVFSTLGKSKGKGKKSMDANL